jgi:murein DD-endopeptidase MepM/ murein hydrolase activator NlpD
MFLRASLALVCLLGPAVVGAIELDGKLTQGALVRGQTEPGTRITLNGDPVRVTEDGRFAIGFGRDADLWQRLVEIPPNGEPVEHNLELSEREYDIQRIEGVPQRTVTPDESALERIRAEAAQVRQARAVDSDRTDFTGDFIWPAGGRISGVYGSQRFYNGEPRRPHYGVDIAAPTGTPVVAPASGVVTLVHPDMYFSGGTLLIDHGYGISSTFIHLSEVLVEEGEQVSQGEVVAKIGASGRATGPHLDWRINWYGERLDPVTVAPSLTSGRVPAPEGISE